MRAQFLSLLVRRAEQQTARTFPYRRVSWPVIQAAAFAAHARARRMAAPRTIAPSVVSANVIGAASRSEIGLGRKGQRRGARWRMRAIVATERAFDAMGEGLRLEELSVLTRIDEIRMWRFLQWCSANGVYANRGEMGWFRVKEARR